MRISDRDAALATIVLLLVGGGARADDDAETRLREQTRRAVGMLRDAEDENAALKAKQAESDRQLQALQQQIDALKQQQTGAEAQSRSAEQVQRATAAAAARAKAAETETADIRGNLAKWQAAYQQAADVARARDADAKRLAAGTGEIRAQLDRCAADNLALFKLGNEILNRYREKGVGEALSGAEPFTQLSRVKLENLVQEYQEKLEDRKAPPPSGAGG